MKFSFITTVFLLCHSVISLAVAPMSQKVSWETLVGLDSKTGKATPQIKSLNGKRVSIPGFIVPLDFSEAREVKEFLVTPSYPGCVHVPPPTPNQTVLVKMQKGKKAKMSWGPIWVSGVLKVIEQKKTAYGEASYELAGISIEDYDLASGGDRLVDQVITGVPSEPIIGPMPIKNTNPSKKVNPQ